METSEIYELKSQFSEVATKLDGLLTSIAELKADLKSYREQTGALEIWRETTNGRLAAGAERMNHLEKQFGKEVEELKKAIEARLEKRILMAYLLGVSSVSAGGTAIAIQVMKAIGL